MERFDVIIVGGGIQGAAAALEASRRGQRAVLIERGVVGSGASANSFGIVHGGLRYLQSLDLPRWRTSRREQAWFQATFPELVEVVECAMFLYRGCFRSPTLFRTAFALDRMLGGGANGRVVKDLETSLPIERIRLIGAAVWTEAGFQVPSALVGRLLAMAEGVVVRERTAVSGLRVVDGVVEGVETAAGPVFAPRVFVCAGAANRSIAARFDKDRPELSARTLAFNLLFDLPYSEPVITAVSPTPGRGRSYFVRSHEGRLLAGTAYIEASQGTTVPEAAINDLRADLAKALPGLALDRVPIAEVWSGLLPDRDGTGRKLRAHDLLIDHGAQGGPRGLYTLHPTKLTTTRDLAARAAAAAWPGRGVSDRLLTEGARAAA